jgi:hypothetical protein
MTVVMQQHHAIPFLTESSNNSKTAKTAACRSVTVPHEQLCDGL